MPFNIGITTQISIEFLSRLGVSFLLFIVGLEMNWQEIGRMKGIFWVGLCQVFICSILGFSVAMILGFGPVGSAILGLIFAFSSTIMAVKALSDQGRLLALEGRLALGILLLQDLVAIAALSILPFLPKFSSWDLFKGLSLFFNAGLFFSLVYFLSKDFLGFVFDKLTLSAETLILGAIAWCLTVSLLAQFLGLSLEIGAFTAGLALAGSIYRLEISARIKPLKDVFLALFFVGLGLSSNIYFSEKVILPALIFGGLILIVKPLISYLLLQFFGYQRRPAFLAALSLGQSSEFSLILILALNSTLANLVVINFDIVRLVSLVTIGTMAVSSAMMNYSKKLYPVLARLPVLLRERKTTISEGLPDVRGRVIIIGIHRIGEEFLSLFEKLELPVLAVDINPLIVEKVLDRKKKSWDLAAVYGDCADPEFLAGLGLENALFLVSTVPFLEENLILLKTAKKVNRDLLIIVTAQEKEEAKILYENGASYVILPQVLGGRAIAEMLHEHLKTPQKLVKIGQKHYEEMKFSKK